MTTPKIYDWDAARAAEKATLQPTSAERAGDVSRLGMSRMTLGDLLVYAFTPGPLNADEAWAPEEWETFEQSILRTQALELRALGVSVGQLPQAGLFELTSTPWVEAAGGPFEAQLGPPEIARLLLVMSRRTEALGELAKRLRVARWGDPHFGGGDAGKDEHPAAQQAAE